jgi:CubicO group peptidase (beta-lactamase class C family)
MTSLPIFSSAVSLLFLASCTSQEAPGSSKFDLKQEMHDLVHLADKRLTEISGLQMVLIKNGQIIFEHAEGFARRVDGVEVPLSVDHKVRIASISKFVLTMAFMSLVEDGKVDLDTDISKYLGFQLRNPAFPKHEITARQLLSHTSSIRDGSYYFMGIQEDYRDFFRPGSNLDSAAHYDDGKHFSSKPKQEPGKFFTYANLNFGVVAGIIESVSGQRMDLFVKEKLFDPLGLNSSFSVCTLHKDDFSAVATLYRRGDAGVTWDPAGPWIEQVDGDPVGCFYESARYKRGDTPDLSMLDSYETGRNPTLFSPQGGLRASAKDMAVLMQALLQDGNTGSAPIISRMSIDQMMQPVWQYDDELKNGHTGGEAAMGDPNSLGMMTSYGLSTHIIDLKDWGLSTESRKLYGHLGSAYGLQGQFWFDPIARDGFIAFVTGLGDDPDKAEKTIPLLAIEEAVLRLALEGLETHH